MIFAFVRDELAADYPVGVACDVLGVSRSGYYAWAGRAAGPRATRRAEPSADVARVFGANRGVYGSPRVCRALLLGTGIAEQRRTRPSGHALEQPLLTVLPTVLRKGE